LCRASVEHEDLSEETSSVREVELEEEGTIAMMRKRHIARIVKLLEIRGCPALRGYEDSIVLDENLLYQPLRKTGL